MITQVNQIIEAYNQNFIKVKPHFFHVFKIIYGLDKLAKYMVYVTTFFKVRDHFFFKN